MERLTFDGDFCDIALCAEVRGGSFCEDGACSQRKTWERLKAYEATGLTPECCAELAQADEDGRLVVLPCKVGDTVWFRTYTNNGDVDLGVQPHEVTDTRAYVIVSGEFTDVSIPVEHFGKTAFLTREEAEQALKEAKEDG